MSQPQIEPLGDSAALLRFGDRIDVAINARVHHVAHVLRQAQLGGIRDIVPAYASLVVHYDAHVWADGNRATAFECIARKLQSFIADRAAGKFDDDIDAIELVEIPVCYDPAFALDLDATCAHVGLDAQQLVDRHTANEYRVAMIGFAPGFPYLLGLDAALHMPRRANPRTQVPPGSVAIGGAQTGIYPHALPGGWHVIGRTPLRLFDVQRTPASLLAPGQRVRFRNISASVYERESQKAAVPGPTSQQKQVGITVLKPGLLTTVQDSGRHGVAASGVGTAGAMDDVSLRLANALVGNDIDAAAFEITLLGPTLQFEVESLIAICGAEIEASCEDRAVPAWRPVLLRAGQTLKFGRVRRGARAYLAIAGGITLAPMLGSRSTDLNAHLGPLPRALTAGDTLAILPAPDTLCADLKRNLDHNAAFAATTWSLDPAAWFSHDAQPLRALPGTHFASLEAASQQALFTATFRIGVNSNRVGLRLEGHALQLHEPLELISEGVTPGTLQLPPGGVPIALAAEAPTTGGYPRIAHIASVDLPRLAQLRPGDTLQLMQVDLGDAQMRYLERERALTKLCATISQRLRKPW